MFRELKKPGAPSTGELTAFEMFERVESLRPLRKRSRVGAIVLASTVAIGSILPADIAFGKAAVADSLPIIHPIAEQIGNEFADTPIVYMDGFARQDSSWQAGNMAEAIQASTDSSISALEYGENGITVDIIAHQIAESLEGKNATSVSLYGYSIGGDVALQVADILINKYDITVKEIYLDHTPADAKSIDSEGRTMGAAVLDTVHFFESIGLELQYSSIARTIVNEVIPADMTYTRSVSSSVIIDQYTLGTSIDTAETINNLQSDQHPTPVLIYITSSDPESDDVIDLVRSDQEFEQKAADAHVPYISLAVEGGPHGRPDLVIDSYKQVLMGARREIDQAVAAQESLQRMQSGSSIKYRIHIP